MLKDSDLPFEIDDSQIHQLMKLADLHKTDIFYDLGSGSGRVIIVVAKDAQFKKAIGIESERELYEKARLSALNELTIDQLKKIDYWFGNFDFEADDGNGFFYDLSDATVIYNSVDEDDQTVKYFKMRFGLRRHVKIITKNLPFVGYASVANRSNPKCWFFLTINPPKRIKSKVVWARSVLGTDDATMEKVYDYYAAQIDKQYPDMRKYREGNLLDLKKLVNDRF